MKSATIFILLAFFCISAIFTHGQSFLEPSPIMNKKILKAFIQAHLVYPEKAKEKKIEGKVMVLFMIDEKGQITDRKIKESVSPEIDSSALHLFDLIVWKPAKAYGIPVKSTGEFGIQFHLKKYAKYVKSRGYDQIKFEDFNSDTSNLVFGLNQLNEPPTPIISNEYSSLNDFIINELNYPEEAKRLGIKGSVTLSFIIELNGIPSNIYVKETLGGGCCEESIRILQLIKWFHELKYGLILEIIKR